MLKVPLTVPAVPAPALLKLDIGCGTAKREGFLGVDAIDFPGVDVVMDVRTQWPWPDNSVAEVHCSHFLEHLTGLERVHFANQLYRVLVPGEIGPASLPVKGFATVIVPHWCSHRAYGDPTHQWPPVSEMWFYYLSRDWRLGNPETGMPANAPHTDDGAGLMAEGFSCNFEARWGYSFHPELMTRAEPVRQDAAKWRKEAIQDMQALLIKRA